jgi:L-threonylcarbamoyladenylate synthase
VARRLGDRLGLVLDGGRSPGGIPSTVVAMLPDAAGMSLLRAGALPFEEIEAALAETEV